MPSFHATSLFDSVPPEDVCHLFKRGQPDGPKVAEFLKYKKEDVSVAARVPVTSVRYDDKMSAQLRERITEWAIAINLVGSFFKDFEKTHLWFQAPNPMLGGLTPRDMIRIGRFRKLLKFIQAALTENKPER